LLEEKDIVYLIKEKIGLKNFLLQLMDSLETGFKKFADRRITVPARYEFFFPLGSIASMTAADDDYFACKIVNTHLENSTKFSMPSVLATGLLLDVQTGYPIMVTESAILTALRTGITSAIATKYLANKKSGIVGIIGNGAQALAQLHAISLIRNIEKVHAYDIDENASKSFRSSAEKLLNGTGEVIISDAKTTSSESDVLISVTSNGINAPPVVYESWIRNGTHINAVGGCVANQIELEKSLLDRAKVVVDFRDQAIYEGESQQLAKEQIYADLSEIVSQNKDSRIGEDEVTVFDSVGFAMEDLQTLKLVYDLAIDEGVGKIVNISARPRFSKNLYESYFL
jgi:ornithine cyclodeaminase/alanine dehydrogenase-like protein (mu-crystallin family)